MRYVVDIGNSGLRCARCPAETQRLHDGLPPLPNFIHKLVWHPEATMGAKGTHSISPEIETAQALVAVDDVEQLSRFVKSVLAADEEASQLNHHSNIEWYVSSVHALAMRSLKTAIMDIRPRDAVYEVTFRDVPMHVDVQVPERLGVDRLLAAYGAFQSVARLGPVIVVQAGTAITADLVSDTGVYLGGAIMPGVALALFSLGKGTDKLPWLPHVELHDEMVLPGKNTEQAILAGVQASIIGGTIRLVERYRNSLSNPQIPVVVSGGGIHSILAHIPKPAVGLDNLVLRALTKLFGNP